MVSIWILHFCYMGEKEKHVPAASPLPDTDRHSFPVRQSDVSSSISTAAPLYTLVATIVA